MKYKYVKNDGMYGYFSEEEMEDKPEWVKTDLTEEQAYKNFMEKYRDRHP